VLDDGLIYLGWIPFISLESAVFYPFQVEQFLSDTETGAEYHVGESGVHPMTLGELMNFADMEPDSLGDVTFHYPEVNGTLALRENIAALYEGASADNVLVTVGASEANHVITSTLLEPGDEVIAFRPTYQQLPGNAANMGIEVETVGMEEDNQWALDVAELESKVSDKTRFIHVVNPNNPTGHILDDGERGAIIRCAEKSGAWIVADEVYAGTEREQNHETPGFWGDYDRVIAINSMSKAYGLPGLRLGWIVAPEEQITAFWRRHEYITISATMLAMVLAEKVLSAEVRPKIIERSRRLIRVGFDHLKDGLDHHPGVFSVVPPQASAMSFVKFDLPMDSMTFAKRLLTEKKTLIIPGSCFGLENHFRISSALPEDYLGESLRRINELVSDILAEA
jgi:aspartate/methionine/tyrosine aminotransferase